MQLWVQYSTIGYKTLIQPYTVVAYDYKVGNSVRIDTRASFVGGVIVERYCNNSYCGYVNHKCYIVGEYMIVAACRFIINKLSLIQQVFGVHAKTLDF